MELEIGKQYRHYKGKPYKILAVALHADTLEKMVVYEGQYDDEELGHNPVFVRPYDVFIEHVIVDGEEVLRFTPIGE
jgi:hypothetical protein